MDPGFRRGDEIFAATRNALRERGRNYRPLKFAGRLRDRNSSESRYTEARVAVRTLPPGIGRKPLGMMSPVCETKTNPFPAFTPCGARPMVWPAVLTMIVLNTINIWNELLFALLFIVDEDKRTLPIGLYRFYGYHNTDYALVFAALTITTIPVLLLYFILQRHVIAGLTATSMD